MEQGLAACLVHLCTSTLVSHLGQLRWNHQQRVYAAAFGLFCFVHVLPVVTLSCVNLLDLGTKQHCHKDLTAFMCCTSLCCCRWFLRRRANKKQLAYVNQYYNTVG